MFQRLIGGRITPEGWAHKPPHACTDMITAHWLKVLVNFALTCPIPKPADPSLPLPIILGEKGGTMGWLDWVILTAILTLAATLFGFNKVMAWAASLSNEIKQRSQEPGSHLSTICRFWDDHLAAGVRRLGLLFSLLLLVVFGFLMFVNFISVAFGVLDFFFYLVIASIVYLIVKGVGTSLDNKFNQSVQEFLDGKKKELFHDKVLVRTFGLLLITLLPFLFYLLALSLFATTVFTLLGLAFLSSLRTIPMGVLFGLGFVAIGTGFAILVGFYHLFFPPTRKTLGICLGQNEQRKIWDITAAIGREIKAKPIDAIFITPLPGIGVYLQGSLFTTILGGGTRVLQVGLPSLHGLAMDEFKAILAHEYGHFSNRDTQWGSFTYSMGNSLVSTLGSLPGPGKGGGLFGLMMWLNPAYWMVLVFVRLYFRLTNGFSRIREVMADIAAMNLCGGRAFGQGLLKVATNDELFVKVVHAKWVPKLLEKEKTIPNFSKTLDQAYTSIGKRALDEIQAAILSRSQTHSVYDSHPALKVRLDYAKKFETGEEKYAGPVRELFEDWDRLNEKAAELYYQRLFS